MLFISPPFGNYISLPNTISIKGSYTLEPRKGLWGQIFKTLRYSFKYGGWINKIGLRNMGLDYAIQNYNKEDIISIAILDESEIKPIINKIPIDMNIELNVSCPNLDKNLINNKLECFLNPKREWCIIKLSPLIDLKLVDSYYKKGFRQFHCCNTLPIKEGGLSGPILEPYVNIYITNIRKRYPDTIIIAGGGIRNMDTAKYYLNNGANHVSVSTLCFNPILFGYFYYNYKKY